MSRTDTYAVEKDYYLRCMQEAIINAGISADQIDLVVPHGIGTSITDLHEARAITKLLGGSNNYLASSFKPYFGHNLGSCALLETALLLLALTNDFVPKSLNCEPVDPQIKINLALSATSKKIKTGLKVSCGFAGYNGAAVFSRLN